MRVSGVCSFAQMGGYLNPCRGKNKIDEPKTESVEQNYLSIYSTAGVFPVHQITFGEQFCRHRTVPDIEFEEYKNMTEAQKKYLRKRYEFFQYKIDKNELFDPKDDILPLRSEKNMDDFLKVVEFYNQFKDDNVLCLGRSPKWFLNASLWMKNGLKDYKFVAFSGFWFFPDPRESIRRLETAAPKQEDVAAYRKYLKSIKADPVSIVNDFQKKGKRTIITDYICTGKGMTSFLDLMSEYADDMGILDEFAKAIKIVGIGSMDYMEELNPYADEISEPEVKMPPKLRAYKNELSTTFYNMPYPVFCEMLLNQNTNECRSTYYPSANWRLYKPYKFKTGLIKDVQKVDKLMKISCRKTVSSFLPAMMDFRNLLNFRILDALNARNLLKEVHRTKK